MTNNAGNSIFPSAAVQDTNVYVVWSDARDGNNEIYFKRSADAGSSWGQDARLTNDAAISTYPSIAVSGSDLHVVWKEYRDGNPEIYYKRSVDRGSNWGLDTRLTNDAASSTYPQWHVPVPTCMWFGKTAATLTMRYTTSAAPTCSPTIK